jgi:hypothetical protein
MKFAWLEKMAEEGQIRPEVADYIQNECNGYIEKIAMMDQNQLAAMDPNQLVADILQKSSDSVAAMLSGPPEAAAGLKAKSKTLLNFLAMGAATAGVGLGITAAVNYGMNKLTDARIKAAIDVTRSKVLTSPLIPTKDKDKAAARFDEILRYAPSLGPNEAVMLRLVTSKYRTGLTDSDVHNLVNIQAKMTPNPMTYAAKSQQYMGKTASAEDVKAAACGEYFANIYIEMEKLATGVPYKELGKNILYSMSVPVSLALVGTGISAIKGKIDQARLTSRLENSYQKVMQSSPGSILSENKAEAREAFDTLAHFAPHIAMEPHAARAFIIKVVGFKQGPQASDLKDITEVERNMIGAGRNTFNDVSTLLTNYGIVPAASRGLETGLGQAYKSREWAAKVKHDKEMDLLKATREEELRTQGRREGRNEFFNAMKPEKG